MFQRMRVSAKLATVLVACAIVSACGAMSSRGTVSRQAQIHVEPATFLQEVGGEASPALRRSELDIDALDARRREARGDERRAATRDLIAALAFAADDAEESREARRFRRRAERHAEAAVRGTRDQELLAEVSFLRLWMAWRSGSASAAGRAERFTRRFRAAGILTTIGWMIRGEIAFADERWDDATEAYRFALGQLGTPLYGFALFRTAHAQRGNGDTARASDTLGEVAELGCDHDAPPALVRIATAAASEAGAGVRQDTDGVIRPAVCPSPSERDDEEEGWRPAE